MSAAELAHKVRLLEIQTRHLVNDIFSGEYESVFKGRGVEFADDRIDRRVERAITAGAKRRQAGDDPLEMSRQRSVSPWPLVFITGIGGRGHTHRREAELPRPIDSRLHLWDGRDVRRHHAPAGLVRCCGFQRVPRFGDVEAHALGEAAV